MISLNQTKSVRELHLYSPLIHWRKVIMFSSSKLDIFLRFIKKMAIQENADITSSGAYKSSDLSHSTMFRNFSYYFHVLISGFILSLLITKPKYWHFGNFSFNPRFKSQFIKHNLKMPKVLLRIPLKYLIYINQSKSFKST